MNSTKSENGMANQNAEKIDHTDEQCNCENPVLDTVEEDGVEHVFCIACT